MKKTEIKIRLNKYLAQAGIASRREADRLISLGLVTINGKVVCEMGYKVNKNDIVFFDGKKVVSEQKRYLLLNKPKNCITTTDDPQKRNTVMHLIKGSCKERVYPVGRLDRNTTGLLLFTNDGELAKKLTHPSSKVKKMYHVVLNKRISQNDLNKIKKGVKLEEGTVLADSVSFIKNTPKNEVGIELHLGWNRVVRRMFEKLGYSVVKLDRVMFSFLTKKKLQRKKWRFLTKEEITLLKRI